MACPRSCSIVLAKVSELKVAARTSSFSFKGSDADIAEIAQKLKVAHILEGSLRKAGSTVRITAQLIKADEGYHLWSETWDRDLSDIFKVQDEIAAAVVEQLKIEILGEKLDVGGTDNHQAYEAFLQGRYFWNKGASKETIEKALSYYDEALSLDPEYAKALAGRAQMLYYLAIYGIRPFEETTAEANAIAENALRIAPGLAEAQMVQGNIAFRVAWDWAKADAAFERAIELNPGSEQVLGEYSVFLSAMDRGEAAISTATAALDLDPLSLTAAGRLARSLYFARKYTEASKAFEHVLELEPERPRTFVVLSYISLLNGDPTSAIELASEEPTEWLRRMALMLAYHKIGKIDEAHTEKQWLIDNFGDVAAYQYIQIHAQWGEIDEAIKWLEFAYEKRDPGLADLKVDPLMDPLRQDKRFITVLEALNLQD